MTYRACPLPFVAFACALAGAFAPILAEAPRGYYRFPAIHDDAVVFVAEGDLWTVGVGGGIARRLTSHLEEELHPAISPDGRTVAFSANYEGPTEVYTMPLAGGLPSRRTWEGGSARVVGWTPGAAILYSTRKYATLPDRQLVSLEPASGERRRLPLAQAADGCFAEDGRTLYFTRLARQSSETKRYHGGTAQNLWSFTTGDDEARPLTADWTGTSALPMCWEDRVYFVSDRDGTLNLWSMRADGTALRQHTEHVGWDVLEPDLSRGRIVYQLGADLRLYDIATDRDEEIPIQLASDFEHMRERWVEEPLEYVTAAFPSPDGDRVAVTARGEIFVMPTGQGRRVHVTRRPDVRYRSARFLPDGKSLIALSDESGEVEWWRLPASGIGEPEQLTTDGKVLRFDGVPSPDGKWIVHYDQDQRLWLSDLGRRESRQIDFSPQWGFDDPSWSPDSRWLLWARPADNGLSRIFLHEVATDSTTPLTSDRYDSWSARFSPDGKWIYFLSDRDFNSLVRSPWGSRQPQPFFDRSTRIYHVALEPGQRSPFRPDDELDGKGGEQKSKPGKQEKTGKKKGKQRERSDDEQAPPTVTIELDGLASRVEVVPVRRHNMSSLFVNDATLCWIQRKTDRSHRHLVALEIGNDEPEPLTLVENVRSYEPSQDGKKLLVRRGSDLLVIDAEATEPDLDSSEVELDDWRFSLDPREEWRQLFVESWRLERDYFYDRGMHGVDWQAMLDKYLPLVDRVTTRSELADLQAQLAGELSALHIFVRGGDRREDDLDVSPASLGAVLERDEHRGGYRVAHVYEADPELPDELAPLARPGVGVREGDVIEAINGVPTLAVADPALLLRNQEDRQVRLRVLAADGGEARDVIVVPFSQRDEADLRYDEWEYTRRRLVDERAAGRIGYVHLRAMGSSNIGTWYRDFYPVFDRQGLIIDVRHNRGGNIDSWILEKLLRRAWFYWQPRVGDPTWNMQNAFRGHMIVLVDAWTASDGEAFAEGFRRLGLGPVLGTRTWGGEIWLTGSNGLVDRGIVTAAEFGVYGPEGEWLIEGHGVDPDIEVDNLPHATFRGEDAQLEAAIDYLEQKIRDDPRPVPEPPPYPDKSLRETSPR